MNIMLSRAHSHQQPAKKQEAGNSLLEMLLFTPLALFFLFAVIDGGLLFRDKAAVTEAVRSGINSSPTLPGYSKFIDSSGEENDSLPDSDELLQGIADEVAANIRRSQGIHADNPAYDTFRVSAALVRMDIDPDSGRLIQSRIASPEAQSPKQGSFDIRQAAPDFPHQAIGDFVQDSLSEDALRPVSSFASPAAAVFRFGESAQSRYRSHAYAICVEVTALPKTISAGLTKILLGKYFALEEHQLLPLRVQRE
jgi:hypothetical protein